jgi:acylphosphatase
MKSIGRKRWQAILLGAAVAAVVAACGGGGNSSNPAPANGGGTESAQPHSATPALGSAYMYTSSDGGGAVGFLSLTNQNGNLSGFLVQNSASAGGVTTFSYTVTGTVQGVSVSLTVKGNDASTGVTSTGQLRPNGDLQFTSPGSNGQVVTTTFRPTTVKQYDDALAQLKATHPSPTNS